MRRITELVLCFVLGMFADSAALHSEGSIPIPACVFGWCGLLMTEHPAEDLEIPFVATKLSGDLWDALPFSVLEVIYRARRPTLHLIVVTEGDSCAVLSGPTSQVYDLPMSPRMEFFLTFERFNSFVSKLDISTLKWSNEQLSSYVFAILKIATTAWGLDPPKVILVSSESDIPGAKSIDVKLHSPVVKRSQNAALVDLFTWDEWLGILDHQEVLVREDGTLAVDRSEAGIRLGNYLPVLERY